jgi:hypothetical protein
MALARRVRRDIRDQLLVVSSRCAPVRESAWLRERLGRINSELKSRRA